MGYIRITIIRPVTLDDIIDDAMAEFDEMLFLGECIRKIGVPVSVDDFIKGVQADTKLPEQLKELVIQNVDHFFPLGWWFVAKSSNSPLAGQMVRVTALTGEGESMMATVSPVSAHDTDPLQNPTVPVNDLSGTFEA